MSTPAPDSLKDLLVVAVVDATGRIVALNQSAVNYFVGGRGVQAIGTNLVELIEPTASDENAQQRWLELKAGAGHWLPCHAPQLLPAMFEMLVERARRRRQLSRRGAATSAVAPRIAQHADAFAAMRSAELHQRSPVAPRATRTHHYSPRARAPMMMRAPRL